MGNTEMTQCLDSGALNFKMLPGQTYGFRNTSLLSTVRKVQMFSFFIHKR